MPRPVDNPPNPWAEHSVDYLGDPPPARLEVFEERARSALSKNSSPDIPFRYGLNPYRGCLHGCAYCYARPTHEYLGFGAGTDFDRKIVVKTDLAAVLDRELQRPSYRGEAVALSGNTDCYQALEASYGITRACLEVLVAHAVPFSVVTKSALVTRDIDLLVAGSARAAVTVAVSLPMLDPELCAAIEPWASRPARRIEALRALSDAGLDTVVAIAPVIPGLNDDQVPAVLEAARAAGARRSFLTMVRLPGPVREVFAQRLRAAFPDRADKVLRAIAECRGGDDADRQGARSDERRFFARMTGQGARWQAVEQLYATRARALGLEGAFTPFEHGSLAALRPGGDPPSGRRGRQLGLFD